MREELEKKRSNFLLENTFNQVIDIFNVFQDVFVLHNLEQKLKNPVDAFPDWPQVGTVSSAPVLQLLRL